MVGLCRQERHMKNWLWSQNLQGLVIHAENPCPTREVFVAVLLPTSLGYFAKKHVGLTLDKTELQLRLVKYLPVMNNRRCQVISYDTLMFRKVLDIRCLSSLTSLLCSDHPVYYLIALQLRILKFSSSLFPPPQQCCFTLLVVNIFRLQHLAVTNLSCATFGSN